MSRCVDTKLSTDECYCLECTYRRIINAMYDNGYVRGMAEFEARKPEMEKELRDQHEHGSTDRGNGGADLRRA